MDILIEKKRHKLPKYFPYVVGGALLIVLLVWSLSGMKEKRLSVERKQLRIATVIRTDFNDYVRLTGQVQPIRTIQVSALEAGMVEGKLVEEGAFVRKGEVIARLSNPSLNLSILDSEAQLAEKQNFLRNTQVTMEQEKLNLRKESLQIELDIERKRRKAEHYTALYKEQLCSKEDYLQATEEYDYALRNAALIRDRQRQDSLYRGIQVDQMEESLHNMRRNLQLVRERTSQLEIKAPVDGQLGLLDIEIGEMVAAGSKIGQINVLSNYKVEADVDEHYIDRIKTDLPATYSRQGSSYALRVRKVYPEVRNKSFKTELVFVDKHPDNIRTGQSFTIDLELGQPSPAVVVPRDAFYTDTGGQWIFVLSSDGKRASKRKVTIGRQNPDYYEVLAGLVEGEEVIVSSYSDFGNATILNLK